VGFSERLAAQPVDKTISERWWKQKAERYADLELYRTRDRISVIRETYMLHLEELTAYYATPEWAERRRLCIARDHHACMARLPGCMIRATQAHHLTYIHFRNEPIYDLVSVCRACHDQITEMDRRRLLVFAGQETPEEDGVDPPEDEDDPL